jgi:ribosomal protein S18 acetylase RimI-like enzyme
MNVLLYHEITEKEKYTIADWKYEGDCAIYDFDSYDNMKKNKCAFANPDNHFYSYYDGDILAGYTNLYEEKDRVFFGIGVNPDQCGRGYGAQMTEIAYQLSKKRWPDKYVYLEVRTWNARAVNCYKHAGFVKQGDVFEQKTHAGIGFFYRMVRI